MPQTNEHMAQAEVHRAQAQATLDALPQGSRDLVQVAQLQMLEAILSALLALAAAGGPAPGSNSSRR